MLAVNINVCLARLSTFQLKLRPSHLSARRAIDEFQAGCCHHALKKDISSSEVFGFLSGRVMLVSKQEPHQLCCRNRYPGSRALLGQLESADYLNLLLLAQGPPRLALQKRSGEHEMLKGVRSKTCNGGCCLQPRGSLRYALEVSLSGSVGVCPTASMVWCMRCSSLVPRFQQQGRFCRLVCY